MSLGAVVVAVSVVACASSKPAATPPASSVPSADGSAATTAAPKVTSSIADGAVLTKPLVWSATSDGEVDHVDFLIDGKVQATETESPYQFNEGRLLVPWTLTPGPHHLAVHAVTADGAQAQRAVAVTVPPRVAGSFPLGTYQRTVTEADASRVAPYRTPAHGSFGERSVTGRWTMRVTDVGVTTFSEPGGPSNKHRFVEPYLSVGTTVTLYNPAVWLQPDPKHPDLFCEPENPSHYTLATTASGVRLTPVEHACADRDMVVAGEWQRTAGA
jgi:hypothetical protein